jgi:ribosomal protein S25
MRNNRLIHAVYRNDLINLSTAYDDINIIEESSQIFATNSSQRTSRVTPEKLAQRWGIGVNTAKLTLKFTTQKGVRYAIGPPEKRFRTK